MTREELLTLLEKGKQSLGTEIGEKNPKTDPKTKIDCPKEDPSNDPKEDPKRDLPPSPEDSSSIEDNEEEFKPNEESQECNTLEFEDPGDLLSFFDPEIAEGRVTPYVWQYDLLKELADRNISKDNPYLLAMPAANGSGKDKYIIAPFAVWMLCCRFKARVIITTSSGTQLTSQTEPYISQLCGHINAIYPGFIKVRQRHITCQKTGSEIKLFATDQGGRAEGYHPWEANSLMALIVNEAKSVLPEIFEAIDRCTGASHELLISSPGEPGGDFYKACVSNLYRVKKITAFDCPHIPLKNIEKTAQKYGKSSPIYRSKVLAEFTSLGSLVVIPIEQYERCIKEAKTFIDGPRHAGLDLAAGGDETVLSVFQGNKQIALEGFYTPDSVDGTNMIVMRLEHWELLPENVFADDGGVGRSTIDQIWRRPLNRPRFKGETWNINRVLNQSSAIDKSEFGNRGAELYFSLQRMIQECLIIFIDDPLQKEQLTQRRYKQGSTIGKIILQSKPEARADGRKSPDRADGTVLAFCGYRVEDFLAKKKVENRKYAYNIVDSSSIVNPFRDFEQEPRGKKCYLSIGKILNYLNI